MGLLDDAIREHLELKRLKGADPGAVAREEQDALGPVGRERETEQDSGTEVVPATKVGFSSGPESAPVAESSAAGQETVEINMEAELAAGTDSVGERKAIRSSRAEHIARPAHAQALAEESLEWEVPSSQEADGNAASQGEGDSAVEDDKETAEHIDDVLEETPDFLRDTPEQERLWFEQRPPRDFDFNE